jgi:3-oxoacyl-[acyl-carrier protein] reductase
MNLGLQGKRALVCGASSGLGWAIARELVAEGAEVVLCARPSPRLEAAREAILSDVPEAAGRVHTAGANLTDAADRARLIDEAHGLLGGVGPDILINNTGGPPSGPRASLSLAHWQEAYQSLLESVVDLSGRVVPAMQTSGFGRIVIVTSISVKQPVDGLILSNSLRAGVTGFARTLATEVAPFGITVNCVLPGYTRTERLGQLAEAGAARTGVSPESIHARWTSEIPAGRLGEPDELAALTAFLCSTRAGYITGQSIAVDGGWIRGLL